MSNVSELKIFCKSVDIEFPNIVTTKVYADYWNFKVYWYSILACSGNVNCKTKSELIAYIIKEKIHVFLSDEENLLNIINESQSKMEI